MRVETRHLDTILNHVAELAVVRRRMGRRLEEMTRLVQQWRRDGLQEAADALDVLHAEGSEDYARLATTASTLDETIQQVRLVALHTAMGPLQRVVRDVAAETGKRAHFVVEGGETRLDRRVLDGLRDTLMHLVRNAVDHGLEPPDQRLAHGKVDIGLVRIRAYPDGANVVVEVEDDGRGFDLDAIRASAVAKGLVPAGEVERAPPERVLEYVFLPGFSTAKRVTGISGRGVGLDVVREAVQKLKGTVHLDNRPGRGSVVRLRVPARTGAARVLLVRIAARAYAIPIDAVERVERAKKGAVATPLAHVLELPGATPAVPGQALLALASGGETANVLVDDVLHEQEVVLRPHSALLRRVRNVMGATILDSGEVCIVLNPDDVLRALRRGVERKPRVLVVDDSASAREGIAAALRAAGYETTTAKNGLEALALLGGGGPLAFDAVVTDVEMPGMDGLALTRRLRDDPATTRLPIVMVTSLGTDEARQRGRKAGADGYVVKGADAGERVVQELRAALVRGQVT
jgi:two-component system chemotaxis sensor kinase CheA